MFEKHVIDLLGPLVSDRIRWDTLDDGDVLLHDGCHIVLDMPSGEAVNYVDNITPDVLHTRLRIVVWSKRRALTNNMMRLVEKTLRESEWFKAVEVIGGMGTLHQDDIDGYGSRQDFGVWYAAVPSVISMPEPPAPVPNDPTSWPDFSTQLENQLT